MTSTHLGDIIFFNHKSIFLPEHPVSQQSKEKSHERNTTTNPRYDLQLQRVGF